MLKKYQDYFRCSFACKLVYVNNKFSKPIDSYNNNYDFADDDKYRKIGSIRTLFREFDSDYYKAIRTNDGFAGKKIITFNVRAKGIDMKIYHLKDILV